jgi:hypothetical protein
LAWKGALAALALCALPAAAQERVDRTVAAAADGTVVVESPGGSLRISGWERNEVAVTGSLGPKAERILVRAQGRKTRVEVESSWHGQTDAHADLDIKVPARSQVTVESFQARVDVSAVSGGVRVETVNGGISVTGAADQVYAESVNGGVTVRGRSARVHAESVNGPVTVTDAGPDVQAGTVNGPLSVTGSRGLQRARLESVNGPLVFDGELAPRATLEVENVSGSVELALANPAADFDVSTFNGPIVNELGPPARNTDDDEPGRELVFSVGGGGARVTVRTLSGRVKLSGRGGDARRPRR